MISRDLYNRSTYIEFDGGEILIERVPYNSDNFGDSGNILHTLIQDENLTRLAHKYYGEPLYWYIIADANNIINPFELEVGQILLIPNLDKIL